MTTLEIFASLGNFNNDEEYQRYTALPIEDQAEDDHVFQDVSRLIVGYGHVRLMKQDATGRERCATTYPRKTTTGNALTPISIAINGHGVVMHGPDFVPFTAVPADNENGFEIKYRTENAK